MKEPWLSLGGIGEEEELGVGEEEAADPDSNCLSPQTVQNFAPGFKTPLHL